MITGIKKQYPKASVQATKAQYEQKKFNCTKFKKLTLVQSELFA